MSDSHRVLYIQGIGPEPEVQATFAHDWATPELTVEHVSIYWGKDNYSEVKEAAGSHIAELAAAQEKVHLLAASAGGMVLFDLLATFGESIENAAVINAKTSQYDPTSRGWQTFTNLVLANAALPSSLDKLGVEGRGKLLVLHSAFDERIAVHDMQLTGAAAEIVLPVQGHREGIAYALTIGKSAITNYFLTGTLPTSV